MNIIVKRFDKLYGGYDYVEFNMEEGIFQTGNSRAHSGHFGGNSIVIEVSKKSELKELERKFTDMDFRNYSY